MPDPLRIQALLRREVDGAFVIDRFDGKWIAVQHANVGQQFTDSTGFLRGEGQIMRAPGISADGVATVTSVTTDFGFQFQNNEITKTAFQQFPACRQPSDATANNHDRSFQRRSGCRETTATQPMAEAIGCAHNSAFGQRCGFSRSGPPPGVGTARRERGSGQRAEKTATVHGASREQGKSIMLRAGRCGKMFEATRIKQSGHGREEPDRPWMITTNSNTSASI